MIVQIYEVGSPAEAIEKVKPAGVDSKTKTDKIGSHEKDIEKVKEFVKIAKSFDKIKA